LDGGLSVRRSASGSPSDAEGLGRRLAAEMLAEGAMTLMAEPVR
jgi:hydroxymethylbilane synthase